MAQNLSSVTGNPISLIFPRCANADELLAVLGDVQQFFSKWPAPPEIFVPFLPPKFQHRELQLLGNAAAGFGAAVKEGLKKSKSEFAFVLDLPLAYPFADIFQAWMEFESRPEVDVILGSRRNPESRFFREPPPLYWKVDTWINERLKTRSEIPVADLTTSFYGFRTRAIRPLTLDMKDVGYSFPFKILKRARALNMGIMEKPMHWTPPPHAFRRSVLDHWQMLKMTWK